MPTRVQVPRPTGAVRAARGGSGVPPIVHEVLRSPGRPLELPVRAEMEQRLHHDFSRVRIHSDPRAAASARAVDAMAYAVGSRLVFAEGRYDPASRQGRLLLAHELVHVAQSPVTATPTALALDSRTDSAEREARAASSAIAAGRSVRISGGASPTVLRRQRAGRQSPYADDPSFLVCLALCELGVPPGLWRTIVRSFLDAVWAEFSARYDQARANAEFNDYRTAFRAYSAINMAKAVLGFIAHGRIGLIPIRSAAAQAVRTRIITMVVGRGATMAGIEAAEQIVRRIAVAIELAIAAGCLIACGAVSYIKAVTELTTQAISAVADTLSTLGAIASGISSGVGGLLSGALLSARATVDPTNWDLTGLPSGLARNDTRALGVYLWSHIASATPDQFVTTVARPLSSFAIPRPLVDALAAELSQAIEARFRLPITITPELLLGLSVLSFAQFLHDWRLMTFRREPEQVASEALSTAGR